MTFSVNIFIYSSLYSPPPPLTFLPLLPFCISARLSVFFFSFLHLYPFFCFLLFSLFFSHSADLYGCCVCVCYTVIAITASVCLSVSTCAAAVWGLQPKHLFGGSEKHKEKEKREKKTNLGTVFLNSDQSVFYCSSSCTTWPIGRIYRSARTAAHSLTAWLNTLHRLSPFLSRLHRFLLVLQRQRRRRRPSAGLFHSLTHSCSPVLPFSPVLSFSFSVLQQKQSSFCAHI